jgi:hypothetical protein
MDSRFSKYVYVFLVAFVVVAFGIKMRNSRGVSKANQDKTLGIQAEQTGSSPNSGVDSKLKEAYDDLVTLGTNYGDSSSNSDWSRNSGTYWNRIMYAATWDPGGTATESDVATGKTFYSGSDGRTMKTGTGGDTLDYSEQQYVSYVDGVSGDYEGEESTWTNTNTTSGSEVWYDTRAGLYWSDDLGTSTNDFTVASCDFFTTDPRGDYDGSDGDCGNAINACANLSLAANEGGSADTDWYLSTIKELNQAYINGFYNQAGSTFAQQNGFWSSTERSSTTAWKDTFHTGRTYYNNKTSSEYMRCVRRD